MPYSFRELGCAVVVCARVGAAPRATAMSRSRRAGDAQPTTPQALGVAPDVQSGDGTMTSLVLDGTRSCSRAALLVVSAAALGCASPTAHPSLGTGAAGDTAPVAADATDDGA